MKTLVKNEKDKYRGQSYDAILTAILKMYYPLQPQVTRVISQMELKAFGNNMHVLVSNMMFAGQDNPDIYPDFKFLHDRSVVLKKPPKTIGKLAIDEMALLLLNTAKSKCATDVSLCNFQHISVLDDLFTSLRNTHIVLYEGVGSDTVAKLRIAVYKRLIALNWLEFHYDTFRFKF